MKILQLILIMSLAACSSGNNEKEQVSLSGDVVVKTALASDTGYDTVNLYNEQVANISVEKWETSPDLDVDYIVANININNQTYLVESSLSTYPINNSIMNDDFFVSEFDKYFDYILNENKMYVIENSSDENCTQYVIDRNCTVRVGDNSNYPYITEVSQTCEIVTEDGKSILEVESYSSSDMVFESKEESCNEYYRRVMNGDLNVCDSIAYTISAEEYSSALYKIQDTYFSATIKDSLGNVINTIEFDALKDSINVGSVDGGESVSVQLFIDNFGIEATSVEFNKLHVLNDYYAELYNIQVDEEIAQKIAEEESK